MLHHIREDNQIAFTVVGVGHDVFGQGRAIRIGAASELAGLAEQLAVDAHLQSLLDGTWDGDIYRIELNKVFAS